MSEATRQVALVTGASRGIGGAIAQRLAADGYAIGINYVSSQPAAEEVRERITASGGVAECFRADISVAAERAVLLAAMRDRFGRIDLLVNNAGIAPPQRADLLDATEGSFARVLDVNLRAPYFLTQAVAKWMIELKRASMVARPRIAFITSISAYASSMNRGDYCVAKAGLSMAVQLWADRLAEFDIPVIEVRPGVIATDMTAGMKEKYDKLIESGAFPQKRWGQPDDVARVVSAFARGDLDYSTGVAIDVSGGFQLRRL
jgi:NAD(P)-dependent dehydrogenase (short-subunit alcohol dehydrogenase family)